MEGMQLTVTQASAARYRVDRQGGMGWDECSLDNRWWWTFRSASRYFLLPARDRKSSGAAGLRGREGGNLAPLASPANEALNGHCM